MRRRQFLGRGLFAAGALVAGTVPGAERTVFPTGGHVRGGREADVFQTVDRFLSRHVR